LIATFITYEYNAKGWLTGIKDGGTNTIVSYKYDAAGRRTRRELENNTFTTYSYDDANQLLAVVHGRAGSPSQPLASYEYRYDAAGNRTNMIRSGMGFQPVHSESYSYDAADQLTGVTYATGSTTDRIVSYLYDAAGNRTNMLEILGTATNTTVYTADADNQLTSATATRQGLTVTGYVQPGAASNKWYASVARARSQESVTNLSKIGFCWTASVSYLIATTHEDAFEMPRVCMFRSLYLFPPALGLPWTASYHCRENLILKHGNPL